MSNNIAKPKSHLRWRVIDISVASVIAVVSAVIYWVVSAFCTAPWDFLQSLVPGLAGLINGLWLFAGPLAAIIIRKPGAALYTELLAGVIEGLMGNIWGLPHTFIVSMIQGIGAEIIFLILLYKRWNIWYTALAGGFSGIGTWVNSVFNHLQGVGLFGKYGIVLFTTSFISGAVFAGILMWFLYKGIRKTGALSSFASGR
ncbi:ECF transporter S component [Gardnerella vaginalis]|uniref:ABC transporter permease n=1 Tax=Gardnerella vaginalis TaxID=2702 RepID=A0A2K1SVP2_GARVA|nr:ECF transporter S component [Gardnerella vaginalis]PNS43610.1 ABC transporter permease [Gardnerella vaginalis]